MGAESMHDGGSITLSFGDVREKEIVTANDFVSHMLEHLAWRMGLKIKLRWEGADWRALGQAFGASVGRLAPPAGEAAALGMIDDGAGEAAVELGAAGFSLMGGGGCDLDYFVSLRCEQLPTGRPLMDLLEGLSEGLGARVVVRVLNLEDPHHAWEGVFRAVGTALFKIIAPTSRPAEAELRKDLDVGRQDGAGEVAVLERGANRAVVRRGTAESGVTAAVDFAGDDAVRTHLQVSETIRAAVADLEKLLTACARELGAGVAVDFVAKQLSSSHVVMEDVGLVLGRALLEVLKVRMERYGANGAGSSVQVPSDLESQGVKLGVSVEGRKFLRFVPEDGDRRRMQRGFLLGQTVLGGLRSEDLDDFLDGLAGGLSAGVLVYLRAGVDPDAVWQELFGRLGAALREAFAVNPYRRGVPPGVKATLA